MTAAALPHESSKFPPEHAGEACHNVVLAREYPMRTQHRPVRVVYAIDPAVLAVAALTDPLAAAVAQYGARLAIKADAIGETPAAALAHSVVLPEK